MANSGPRGGSEGEQLGPYRLVRKLGRGGMGEVWLAEHDTIKSQVAIKLVLAAPDDEEAAARFLREAKATARIRHPGVVTVSDFGPRPAGGAYLVMELLDGETLAERLERGAIATELAIDLGVQMAEALAAAHASGVVHRDLKPANVFLVRDAATRSDIRVKLVDFGVAKATGKVTDELGATVTGALVGTPVYMAPEQCTSRKGPVDHRADLYALGVVLYEMLVGKPPFRGPALGDLIDQHLNETPVSPRTIAPAIPAKLDVLIMTLLAKDRDDRPASANEVARVLHELRGTTPSATTLDETMASGARPGPTGGKIDPSVDETLASVDRSVDRSVDPAASRGQPAPKPAVTNIELAPRPVPKALIWGLVGGFVLFCVILVVIVLGRDRSEAPPAPPADPTIACDQGDEAACSSLADAELLKDSPDLVRIAGWMRGSCDRGHQSACVRLATMFQWGSGVRADIARAFSLAKTACEKGNGAGCDLAGDLAPVSDDRATVAYKYWIRGCEIGDAFSCESAGRRARYGAGVLANPEESKKLMARGFELAKASCERGEGRGCRILGIVYVRGDGVAADAALGITKLQRACDLGVLEACGELGEMYALGANGLNKDPERARKLLETACNRGATMACMTLAVAQSMGLVGGPADPAKAFATAKQVCEERSPRACSILGNFYQSGTGTPADTLRAADVYQRGCDAGDADSCAQAAVLPKFSTQTAKAQELLQRACDLGSTYGCKRLGDIANKAGEFEKAARIYELTCGLSDFQVGCPQIASAYFDGRGVAKDEARARKLLEDACEEGAVMVCHALGTRLRNGKGYVANPVEALRVLDKACGLGWGASCMAVAEMLESRANGIASDPVRAKQLREQACKLDPQLCVPEPAPRTPP